MPRGMFFSCQDDSPVTMMPVAPQGCATAACVACGHALPPHDDDSVHKRGCPGARERVVKPACVAGFLYALGSLSRVELTGPSSNVSS